MLNVPLSDLFVPMTSAPLAVKATSTTEQQLFYVEFVLLTSATNQELFFFN